MNGDPVDSEIDHWMVALNTTNKNCKTLSTSSQFTSDAMERRRKKKKKGVDYGEREGGRGCPKGSCKVARNRLEQQRNKKTNKKAI